MASREHVYTKDYHERRDRAPEVRAVRARRGPQIDWVGDDDAFFLQQPPKLEPVRCRYEEGCNGLVVSLGLCKEHFANKMYRGYIAQTRAFLAQFPDRAEEFLLDVGTLVKEQKRVGE